MSDCKCGYGKFHVYIHMPDCIAMRPDPRTDNPASGIVGTRVGGPAITSEADHFYTCKACGQAVDMRDLGQVFHHEETGHKPLESN